MTALGRFLTFWRTIVVRDREIIDGVVDPAHRGPSPELDRALREWPGSHYWAQGDGQGRLVLIRRLTPPGRERWWLHVLLLILSFITMWMGGALLSGAQLDLGVLVRALPGDPSALLEWTRDLRGGKGLSFAITLMSILLAHEMGHYVLARRYTINASPPYFLPAPPWLNLIGTFGAFIRLRSPVVDRRQLMDVGAAGPWAGFVVALAALLIGLQHSTVIDPNGASNQLILFGGRQIILGDSLLTEFARHTILGPGTVVLHPIAQAGSVGVLVTMLNLIPVGQLDGGHIVYALMREKQQGVGVWALLVLLVLGWQFWGWWLLVAFILLLGGGRVSHPAVLDRYRPLPKSRRPVGWASLLLLAVTFTRNPISW